MRQHKQPTKEQIRHYMASRQAENCAPPSLPEIRRQLGWDLIHPVSGPQAGQDTGSPIGALTRR
jgi:hypothetical protein